jgi:hypothetical protein
MNPLLLVLAKPLVAAGFLAGFGVAYRTGAEFRPPMIEGHEFIAPDFAPDEPNVRAPEPDPRPDPAPEPELVPEPDDAEVAPEQ